MVKWLTYGWIGSVLQFRDQGMGARGYSRLGHNNTTSQPKWYIHCMRSLVGICLWFPQVNERRVRDQMWFRSGPVRPVERWTETWIRPDHRTATGVSAHVAALAQFAECALLGTELGWASENLLCYSLAVIIRLHTTWAIFCDLLCPPTAVHNRSDM